MSFAFGRERKKDHRVVSGGGFFPSDSPALGRSSARHGLPVPMAARALGGPRAGLGQKAWTQPALPHRAVCSQAPSLHRASVCPNAGVFNTVTSACREEPWTRGEILPCPFSGIHNPTLATGQGRWLLPPCEGHFRESRLQRSHGLCLTIFAL